jgi:hypothetical protein
VRFVLLKIWFSRCNVLYVDHCLSFGGGGGGGGVVLSVILRSTASDYSFGIFKLVLNNNDN